MYCKLLTRRSMVLAVDMMQSAFPEVVLAVKVAADGFILAVHYLQDGVFQF